jgi:uncharacterized integral membrane protein
MARIRWFLIVAGVLALMVFSLANTESVPIGMPLLFHTTAPLAMLLAIFWLIGFMVGALWTAWMLHRRRQAGGPQDSKRSRAKRSSSAGSSSSGSSA